MLLNILFTTSYGVSYIKSKMKHFIKNLEGGKKASNLIISTTLSFIFLAAKKLGGVSESQLLQLYVPTL